MHAKKTAFIVEHDFIMAAYLADRVIVYDGIPSKDAVARTPQTLMSGMALQTALGDQGPLQSKVLCVASLQQSMMAMEDTSFWVSGVFRLKCCLRPSSTAVAAVHVAAHIWSASRHSNSELQLPHRDEPVPEEPGHHFPARPHQLPPAHQQNELRQGSGTEECWLLLLP